MASNAIGTGAVVLTANADPMHDELDRAAKDVDKWAAHTDKAFDKVDGDGAGGGLLAIGAKTAVIAAAVAAVTVGASKLAGVFGEVSARIDAAADAAEQLGASVESLTAVQHAATRSGAKVEDLGSALKTLEKNASEASRGGGAAAGAFSLLGINASNLKTFGLEDQLGAIADKLKGVENSADRAALAMQVFGEGGLKLLPLLAGCAEGIRKLTAEARRFGTAIGEDDAGKLQAVESAFDRIGAVVEGAWPKVVVAVAPGIEQLTLFASVLLEEAIPAVEMAANVTMQWVESFTGLDLSASASGDRMVEAFRGVAMAAGYAWDSIEVGGGTIAIVASHVLQGLESIIDGFKDAISDMLILAAKAKEAISLDGSWYRDQAKAVDGWVAGIDGAAERMREWGKSTFESFGDSAEWASKWADRLQEKFDAARQKADQMNKTAIGAGLAVPPKLGGALTAGSKEAYSAITQYQLQARFGNQIQQPAKVEEKQLDEMRKANALAEKLLEEIRNSRVGVL